VLPIPFLFTQYSPQKSLSIRSLHFSRNTLTPQPEFLTFNFCKFLLFSCILSLFFAQAAPHLLSIYIVFQNIFPSNTRTFHLVLPPFPTIFEFK